MRLGGEADALAWQSPWQHDRLCCALVAEMGLVDEHAWDALVRDSGLHRALVLSCQALPGEVLARQPRRTRRGCPVFTCQIVKGCSFTVWTGRSRC